jgi:hypothetical protein
MELGRYDDAFDMSERSRSRALLDLIRERIGTANQAMPAVTNKTERLPAIQAALAAGEAIVQFHSTNERLFAWVIRTDDISGLVIDVSRADLARRVEQLVGVVSGTTRGGELATEGGVPPPPPDPVVALNDAYQLLIAPLRLRTNERLIIVPHGPLHYVPFQALHDSSGYLIQHHAIVLEPSASVAVQLLEKQGDRQARLVAFGNPKRDDVPALKGAEREVKKIGTLFDHPDLFLGAEATKRRFKETVQGASVIHVAAHARVDKSDPLYSSILLAAESGDRGSLEAREIFGMNLTRVSLATLSACSSGLGKIVQGDEALGFTRSFLGAGVSSLIVSLWPVDDASTSLFMSTLYEEWAKNTDIQKAMQKAQVRLLTDKSYADPSLWAPFDLIGNWRQMMKP